ncbi:hypothetical protein ACJMK2_027803 [Sinanodonta woodiana]|uniref:RRM domain-containing protein n=1 Tax=Sinanodonta woodiana TaxID=1069815 RepID=A0ABD3X530_SINWO
MMGKNVDKTPQKDVKKETPGTPVKEGATPLVQQNQIKTELNEENRPNDGKQQGQVHSHGGRGADNSGGGGGGGRRRGGRGGGDHAQKGGDFNNQKNFNQPQQQPQQQSGGEPRKFTGRCRLFVGNIPPDTTEEQFKEMFSPFGESSEVFLNANRGFGFIRMDYRLNAERAKAELDGMVKNGRTLRVRFATHGAALRVKNLSPYVTNELLESAFTQFGEVERAVVIVDDRGRSMGEGIVEFARKPGASAALKRISENVFLMSGYPRPVYVEAMEQKDDEDGLSEKFVQRNDMFRKDREKEPRFAQPGSFEFDFALKFRRIDDMEKEQAERVKRDMDLERKRLEEEMETAIYDYQAEQIRKDLLRQQEELKRLEELRNEQMRRRDEINIRRQEEDRMRRDDEERRRQEMMVNMQGRGRPMEPQQMNAGPRDDMMGLRGVGIRDSPGGRPRGPGTPPMPPPPAPPASIGLDRGGPGQSTNQMQFGNNQAMNRNQPINKMGSSPGQMNNTSLGSDMQRQGQFGEGGQGSGFRSGPGFSSQGGPMGGPSAQGNMFAGGMGGGGGQDRRRDRGSGNPREDYGDLKRMRRF